MFNVVITLTIYIGVKDEQDFLVTRPRALADNHMLFSEVT